MILTFQFETKFFIEISESQFLQQTTTEDERLERDDTEARPGVLYKKGVIKNFAKFAGKQNTCARIFF